MLTTLSQSSLQDYVDCARRFQLRYIDRLAYPAVEAEPPLENEKTYAGGRLSDRFGRRLMVIAGWAVYACAYLAFALASTRSATIAIFLLYGLSFGLTEPSEKAWIADLAPDRLRGTAFGLYHGAVGIAAFPASLLFGALWQLHGAPTAFITGAALATGAVALLVASGRRTT